MPGPRFQLATRSSFRRGRALINDNHIKSMGSTREGLEEGIEKVEEALQMDSAIPLPLTASWPTLQQPGLRICRVRLARLAVGAEPAQGMLATLA